MRYVEGRQRNFHLKKEYRRILRKEHYLHVYRLQNTRCCLLGLIHFEISTKWRKNVHLARANFIFIFIRYIYICEYKQQRFSECIVFVYAETHSYIHNRALTLKTPQRHLTNRPI